MTLPKATCRRCGKFRVVFAEVIGARIDGTPRHEFDGPWCRRCVFTACANEPDTRFGVTYNHNTEGGATTQ